MIDESFEFAEADMRTRLRIDPRNGADTVLQATEHALAQGARLVEPEEEEGIRQALGALAAARAGDDVDLLRAATDRANRETQHLAEILMDSALRESLRDWRVVSGA